MVRLLMKVPKYRSIKSDKYKYELLEGVIYNSRRYNKHIFLQKYMRSDGATGAFDIPSLSWWVHDHICRVTTWSDGTPITTWQASTVLSDILKSEGRWLRSIYWKYATFVFGCQNTRKNGWF